MSKYRDFKGIKNPTTGDVFTNPMFEQALYVNGVLKEPDANGVITLAVGGTYVITGRHYGRIVIGAVTDTPTDDTFIILDGVEIYANDAHAYGIYYAPLAQSLFVTLGRNKINKIICLYEQDIASNQGACLFSENNMVVQGAGYLTVVNKGGHGVRASELRFSGMPHVWCEASHDGIHGNSKLVIHDGYYYINKANDGFGTGTTGHIEVYDGYFYGYNIAQTLFDSKTTGFTTGSLNYYTDASTVTSGMTLGVGGDANYETGVVKVDGTVIFPTSGSNYTVSGADEQEIEITGLINNITISAKKSKVKLNHAKVNDIIYTLSKSNVQVEACKNTLNYVKSIQSSNNINIECKSGSYLSVWNYASGIIGSEITIHDTKGCLVVYNIKGTDIYIADSADHKAYADEAVYGYIKILTQLYTRLSSAGKKSNLTVKKDNMRGCLYVKEIYAYPGSTDTTGTDLGNSHNVFYKEISGSTLKNIVPPIYDTKLFHPYGVGVFPFGEDPTTVNTSGSTSSTTRPITPNFDDTVEE